MDSVDASSLGIFNALRICFEAGVLFSPKVRLNTLHALATDYEDLAQRKGIAVKLGRSPITGALLGTIAVACSPLLLFNTVVPKDRGVRLALHDASFGPDPRQRLDVYRPAIYDAARTPIIVFLYGGSWNSGTKTGYAFVGRALASRGYIVAIPDYRLVPQIRYPSFLEDNAAAVRWLRSHASRFGGDPDRLILMGHSAGAYNAAMLALDPRWLGPDRAAVRGWIGLAGPYDFVPFDQPVTQAAFGEASDPASTQPIAHVRPDAPPTFLATGDKDETVRPQNSDTLQQRLRRVGVRVERTCYPRVGHVGLITAIAKPFRDRAAVLDDVIDFVDRTTRPGAVTRTPVREKTCR